MSLRSNDFSRPAKKATKVAMTSQNLDLLSLSLDRLQPGQSADVVELRTTNPARLDRLSGYGIVPGSRLHLRQLTPAIIFRIEETEISIDREIAREIIVRLV